MVFHRGSDVKSTSPSLLIEVFRVGLMKETPRLIGTASPDIACCFDPSGTSICMWYKSAHFLIGDSFVHSVDKGCPLLSPSNSTPLAKATIFYSCSLHDEGFIQAGPSATFSAVQEMVQQEHAISDMSTPGDAGLTTVVSVASSGSTSDIINILKKIDQVGTVIAEASRAPYLWKRVNEFIQVHPYAKLAWTVLNAAQRVRHFSIIWIRDWLYFRL